ncbi:tetratricopeptide repeat protein [Cochleicola gelatinilyticus]|uniref:Uncharacterized protein n=1 Tax=Cochleicola gelatinilyticus TaxID=1763537 RepID=A0A167HV65_9FLAO|nr:tetratricopeptide repeat protein [Cochleicola gelatinilyticus]OAB78993.1 hypothetical protein ULVI_10495 [Cochleicola gelatinilyticus]
MKKSIFLAGMMLVSTLTFAQKKEIKKAQKANKSGDYTEAMAQLSAAESMIGTADADLKTEFYIAKGTAQLNTAGSNYEKLQMAADSFLKASEMDSANSYANEISEGTFNLKSKLINSAIKDQDAQQFEAAAKKLYTGYTISKQDTVYLYYAAGNAVNAKDYNTALTYYTKLMDLGYTGVTTEFVATNKETGEVEPFASENERSLMLKTGQFIKPETRKTASNAGEILKNATLLYQELGQEDKAIELMQKARAENPDDISLIKAEADMVYKMGDKQRYNELMNEVMQAEPDNPDTLFNLAVGSMEIGDTEKAIEFYEKALEIKPDYSAALINIAVAKLSAEEEIVKQMNELGTSAADNKKYDTLKQQRKDMYADVLPYLEKSLALQPDNVEVVRTLMNIYTQLNMDDKFKTMKTKLQELEGGQ